MIVIDGMALRRLTRSEAECLGRPVDRATLAAIIATPTPRTRYSVIGEEDESKEWMVRLVALAT